tara:strand:- start:819 stop:1067 length:249 start_codon:yes stop_codon:yes gene_type:complete
MSSNTSFFSSTGEFFKQNTPSNKNEENTNNVDIKYGIQGKLSIEVDEKVKDHPVKPSKSDEDDELYRLKKPLVGAPLPREEE